MATKASIKTKLQNLINAGNEATGKQDADLTTVVSSLIEGYGQGGTDTSDATATSSDILKDKTAYVDGVKVVGAIPTYVGESDFNIAEVCSGEHIIEVDELPTENIDENSVYKTITTFEDLIIVDETTMSFKEIYGESICFYYAKTKPTENIQETILSSDDGTFIINLYYVADEDAVFYYENENWVNFSEEAGNLYNGTIIDVSQVTAVGYYVLVGITYHQYLNDTWKNYVICSQEHIIEVKELPTKDIDVNALYRTYSDFKAVILSDGEQTMNLGDFYEAFGVSCFYLTVSTKPKDAIPSDPEGDENFCFYFVQDEDDIFVYANNADTGTGTWVSLGEMTSMSYGGCISNESEASDAGYYYALGGSRRYHRYANDTWVELIIPRQSITITQNSIIDVTNVKEAFVNVPTIYRALAVPALPTDASDGSVGFVLWG